MFFDIVSTVEIFLMTTRWQELLLHNDYSLISSFYEKAIDLEPNLEVNYFYLGLALLLQKKKEEAKTVWNIGLQRSISTYLYYKELVNVLEQESLRQEGLKEYQTAWNIRQYIRQIRPNKYDNLAKICILSLHLQTFNPKILNELGFIKGLPSDQHLNDDLLLNFLIIYVGSYIEKEPVLLEGCLELISSCLPYFQDKQGCLQSLILIASKYKIDISLEFINVFLEVYPNYRNSSLLSFLSSHYSRNREYDKAIQIAQENVLKFSQNIFQKTPQK